MKYGKIIQLCKKNKTAIIFNGDNTQWLSDGQSAYPLYGAPEFDANSLLTLFDITDKAADKMTLKETTLPPQYDFGDFDEKESQTSRGRMSIGFNGGVLIPINTEHGIMFIEQKHMTPLAEENDVEIYVRHEKYTGKPYFVAKTGFCIRAVISPANVIDDHFILALGKIYNDCCVSWENTKKTDVYKQTTIDTEGGDNDEN